MLVKSVFVNVLKQNQTFVLPWKIHGFCIFAAVSQSEVEKGHSPMGGRHSGRANPGACQLKRILGCRDGKDLLPKTAVSWRRPY